MGVDVKQDNRYEVFFSVRSENFQEKRILLATDGLSLLET